MKLRNIASVVLAGVMAVSMLASLAAKQPGELSPEESAQRLSNVFEETIQSFDNPDVIQNLREEQATVAAGWMAVFATVYEASYSALQDAQFAVETRNREQRLEEYKANAYTKASMDYYIYGEDNDISEEGMYYGYKTQYLRPFNRMHTTSYYSSKKTQDFDAPYAKLDYVNGKHYIFMQFAIYEEKDLDTEEDIFTVTRVMAGEGKLYGSMKKMTKSELNARPLVSAYPSFAAFALDAKETFVFDGKTIAIQSAGIKMGAANPTARQAEQAPSADNAESDADAKNAAF